jgi:carboxyl-terminal processing protease
MILRDGIVRLTDRQWRKPVALLVNEGTTSGKEIFAYGFQKYRVGPVIGTRTAGAVLAGTGFPMPGGNLLYLAVADVLVDGARLEGTGVTPDVEVPFDFRYSRGDDPQLERALRVLAETLQPGGAPARRP